MKTLSTCFSRALVWAVALPLVACTPQSDPSKPVQADATHFAFMDGHWTLNQPGRNYTEWWEQKEHYRKGHALEVVLGDTVFSEEMQLLQREGDGWVLGVRMAGENTGKTVFFKLSRAQKGEAVFENPAHDFPKRILYRQMGKDGLYAAVDDGDPEGHKLEYHFVRTGKAAIPAANAPAGHP